MAVSHFVYFSRWFLAPTRSIIGPLSRLVRALLLWLVRVRPRWTSAAQGGSVRSGNRLGKGCYSAHTCTWQWRIRHRFAQGGCLMVAGRGWYAAGFSLVA